MFEHIDRRVLDMHFLVIPIRFAGLWWPSGQGIGSWQACHEIERSTTKDPPCRAAMHVKSETSSRWWSAVRGEVIVFILLVDEDGIVGEVGKFLLANDVVFKEGKSAGHQFDILLDFFVVTASVMIGVNARQVIDEDNQLDENKSSIVCEVQTFEESSCLDIEATIDSVNVKGEVRSNLSSETRRTFIKIQKEDETLINVTEQANKKVKTYEIQDDLLVHNDVVCGEPLKQVVLPACKRKEILQMAHEIPLAGHLGEQKTKQRIKYSFFWPSLKRDVKTYCEACKPCQLQRTLTYRDRIPIQPIVRPNNPFEVWSVDCIGPLEPRSKRGHSYIVCAIDLCSR
ncbi:retrovirus-related Pol polyprotein from transposon 412 [Trichonephila clavipes]|nr:retrovirus-related Pol polyprotein from transposon 412 [Trichonephila clavipes]